MDHVNNDATDKVEVRKSTFVLYSSYRSMDRMYFGERCLNLRISQKLSTVDVVFLGDVIICACVDIENKYFRSKR